MLAINADDLFNHGHWRVAAVFIPGAVFRLCAIAVAVLAVARSHAGLLRWSDTTHQSLDAAQTVDLKLLVLQQHTVQSLIRFNAKPNQTMKALLALLLFNTLTALGQPAQIILFRHAEKPDEPSALHLSPRGEERARALVSLLGTNSPLTSNAPIAALYATHVTKHDHGERTGEAFALRLAEVS